MPGKHVVSLLVLLALFPLLQDRAPAATPTTGDLRGVVSDLTGAPVQGARLELSGDRISRRETQTDSSGAYRFLLLPPGEYTLATDLEGFEQIQSRVVIALGGDSRFDVRMRPAFSADLVVTGNAPRIDLTHAHVSMNITADEFSLLPTRRNFQQLTTLAPGVMMDARNELSPTVSGSTHLENDYIIEGLSTRDPRYGNSATNLTMNFVDEIQVITMNASAEYGRSMGGIFNVLTRSGTNALKGETSAYFEEAGWGSDNLTSTFRGSGTRTLGKDKRDYTLSLGGPLTRDRAWFFGAIGPRDEVIPVELFDAGLNAVATRERTRDERVYAGKITFAATPAHSLTVSAFGNPIENGGWQGSVLWDDTAALYTEHSGSENVTLRYHGILSSQTWLEATAGRHTQEMYATADTEIGRTVPFQIDYSSNLFGSFLAHGGIARAGQDDADRRLLALRGTHIWGNHELRAGVEQERNRYDAFRDETYYAFFGELRVDGVLGVRPVMDVWTQSENGWGTNEQWAAFIEDRLRLGNLTINAGLRWEEQTINSAKGVTIVEEMAQNGALTLRPSRDFTFKQNWAPRLGLVWDPTGRGRAKVFASGGRFFESIPVNVNVAFLNGFGLEGASYYSLVPQSSQTWFNPVGSPLTSNWVAFSQYERHHHDAIDPSTKLQFQDEYSAGGELQLGVNTTIGARVVNRRIGRVIDDRGNWNPANLRARPTAYFLINPGEGEYGSVFRKPERNHTALELTFHRRLAERWQLFSSFVAARSRGDYDGYVEYSSTQFTTPSPNTGFGFDLAKLQENSYGRLRGDRPYQFKLHGSYTFPFGVTLSESFQYSAGIPISAFTAPGLSQGKRAYFLTPRGSEGRTPDHWTLDLHAEYQLPLPMLREASLALIADAFNVTDNHEVLEVDEAYVIPGMPGFELWTAPSNRDEWGFPMFDRALPSSPFYKTPRLYQQPRAIQLGARLRF